MLFKRKFNKGIALEVITEGILFECSSMSGAEYVTGLCVMARELGLLSQKEYTELTEQAVRKAKAAEQAAIAADETTLDF